MGCAALAESQSRCLRPNGPRDAQAVEERELDCSDGPPLLGWRFFRVRRGASGPMLAAPLIHDPDFEPFPSKEIVARCYDQDHPAPAPGCRCGLYVAVEGTLDSLAGYLLDSAHDRDPVVYAEVACTGRLFVDKRGVRAERIHILRLAACPSAWPDPDAHAEAFTALRERDEHRPAPPCRRDGIAISDLDVVPEWVQSNVMPGAPPNDSRLDLDALMLGLWRPDDL